MINLGELFEQYTEEEFLKFALIKNKLHRRGDIHAFLLLDKLSPGNKDIVKSAELSAMYLNIDTTALAKVITEGQVIELIRCGVSFDGNDLFIDKEISSYEA